MFTVQHRRKEYDYHGKPLSAHHFTLEKTAYRRLSMHGEKPPSRVNVECLQEITQEIGQQELEKQHNRVHTNTEYAVGVNLGL